MTILALLIAIRRLCVHGASLNQGHSRGTGRKRDRAGRQSHTFGGAGFRPVADVMTGSAAQDGSPSRVEDSEPSHD